MRSPGIIAVPILLMVAGFALLAWPDRIRKYDQRMTKWVKSRAEYLLVTRLMGGLFILMGVAFLALFLAGQMK